MSLGWCVGWSTVSDIKWVEVRTSGGARRVCRAEGARRQQSTSVFALLCMQNDALDMESSLLVTLRNPVNLA
jgi:hypothetical protein